jgi:hypothetical protein
MISFLPVDALNQDDVPAAATPAMAATWRINLSRPNQLV